MDITLSYGREGLPISLPDDWDLTVVRKPAMPVLNDPAGAVAAALADGVAARPLAEEAEGKQSACILICDVTRPVPNGTILPLDDQGSCCPPGLNRPGQGDQGRWWPPGSTAPTRARSLPSSGRRAIGFLIDRGRGEPLRPQGRGSRLDLGRTRTGDLHQAWTGGSWRRT